MKKVLLVCLAVLLLGAGNVFALDLDNISAKGVKVGLNYATWGGDDADPPAGSGADKKSRLGFVVGGFVTYDITEMFAVQPEVLFTMKGAKYKWTEDEGIMKLTYIEIPVLAKVNIPVEASVAPSVFIGPALGINISAKGFDVDLGTGLATEEDWKDDTKSIEFSLVIGADVAYELSDGQKIIVDARYTLGLTSVDDSTAGDDVKNRVMTLTVGYAF